MFRCSILALLLLATKEPSVRLADIGPAPPTVLVDSAGKPFELARLQGKVVVVSFIFTTCNGTCPLTTAALSRVQHELEKAKLWKSSVEFVSISLEPERDSPEVLSRYARGFAADPAGWHFLTGAASEVDAVLKGWDMWVKRNSAGVLDHPSRIFLVDPRGRQREIYSLEFLTARTVLEDVEELIAEAAGD